MNESPVIWRFGRWIAKHTGGTVRFTDSSGAFEILFNAKGIVGARGLEIDDLGARLGFEAAGETDLISEALALAAGHGIGEAPALSAAKILIEERLKKWFLDADHDFEVDEEADPVQTEYTLSATHVVVEMVLADEGDELPRVILPAGNLFIRRAEAFQDRYAQLGLAEEADLIVAKITGRRTVDEIASRSPTAREDVVKLVAALIASGMLETTEAEPTEAQPVLLAGPEPTAGLDVDTRRIPPAFLLVAAATLIVVIVGLWWFLSRGHAPDPETGSDGHWAISVDLGCEPHEYRRLLQIARRRDDVRPIAVVDDTGSTTDNCWRLVWGDFPSEEAAKAAVDSVPEDIVRDGFEPHVIEIGDEPTEPPEEQ